MATTLQIFTKDKITQFKKDVESLNLRYPVADIAKMTGYSKGNVSDFLSGKKSISEAFIKAFYEAFGSSLKVPVETKEAKANTLEILAAHDAIIAVVAVNGPCTEVPSGTEYSSLPVPDEAVPIPKCVIVLLPAVQAAKAMIAAFTTLLPETVNPALLRATAIRP